MDREHDSRTWIYSNATLALIQHFWGSDVDARRLPNFGGYTLEEQAVAMHTADVIISPHGAQFTNLAFVRPCTAVLELFPRRYYYPKKGPLAMEAGGIPFDGYHFDGSPLSEAPKYSAFRKPDDKVDTDAAKKDRGKLRSVPIRASPESVLRALPDLLHAVVTCRKQWSLVHGNLVSV